jgi:hypothetical protein
MDVMSTIPENGRRGLAWFVDGIEAEAREGYVPASLSPEWHAELAQSHAEGYAEGRAAALAEVRARLEGLPTVYIDDDGDGYGGVPVLDRATVLRITEEDAP